MNEKVRSGNRFSSEFETKHRSSATSANESIRMRSDRFDNCKRNNLHCNRHRNADENPHSDECNRPGSEPKQHGYAHQAYSRFVRNRRSPCHCPRQRMQERHRHRVEQAVLTQVKFSERTTADAFGVFYLIQNMDDVALLKLCNEFFVEICQTQTIVWKETVAKYSLPVEETTNASLRKCKLFKNLQEEMK